MRKYKYTKDFCVTHITMNGRTLWFVNRYKNGKILGPAGIAGKYYENEESAIEYMEQRQKQQDDFENRIKNGDVTVF